MSHLVEITKQTNSGRSLEEIATSLIMEPAQVTLKKRAGIIAVQMSYRKGGIAKVSENLGVSSEDAILLVKQYVSRSADFALDDNTVSASKPVAKIKISSPAYKPSPTLSDKLGICPREFSSKRRTFINRVSIYEKVRNLVAPAIYTTFLNADEVVQYSKEFLGADIPTAIARDVLSDLTGISHGDRVNYWAKRYAQEGRTLVEISRLLGNMHFFATRKLLTTLDLNVSDGFHLVSPDAALQKVNYFDQPLIDPLLEQKEIQLICQGNKYKELGEKMQYSTTRAGQRIDELGLREIWHCAQYLRTKSAVSRVVYLI